MNKISTTFAIITGLFGLALTTRSDVLFSLPIGSVLIVLCGFLFFISYKTQKETNELKYRFLLETLSLEEIKAALGTQNIHSNQILEKLSVSYDETIKTNEFLANLIAALQSELKTHTEQQQNLNEIIIYDVKEALTEFTDSQSRNAEDFADSIKRIMNETNRALHDLPSTLEKFGAQSFETMQKSAEGFLHFENLVNATIEQLTAISNQDYELLKGLLE